MDESAMPYGVSPEEIESGKCFESKPLALNIIKKARF
jgi:hypothetical protein